MRGVTRLPRAAYGARLDPIEINSTVNVNRGVRLGKPTDPRIFTEQNTPFSRRLVAAQARLYSDAKIVFALRIGSVFALAIATAAVALSSPSLRVAVGGGGGVLILLLSLVVGSVEKKIRLRAVGAQEQFDTHVFQLNWSSVHIDRPSQHVVSTAARRYRESRDKDWYGDTKETHRPFDIMICQSTNLGWGVRMHFIWAWTLIGLAALLSIAVGFAWYYYDLSSSDALAALIIPALGPMKEISEQIKTNFEAANTKESIEQKMNELWDVGMRKGSAPSIEEIRLIQDKILIIRQGNPYIPDFFDKVFRESNESAMRASVADKVSQALNAGHGN